VCISGHITKSPHLKSRCDCQEKIDPRAMHVLTEGRHVKFFRKLTRVELKLYLRITGLVGAFVNQSFAREMARFLCQGPGNILTNF